MTDAQDTRWLDEIISQLTVDTGEEYMKLHTGEKSFDASNSHMTYYENQAKQAILAQVAQFFVTRKEAEAREVEAVNKELLRLKGALEIMQLCENDLNLMLIWVKNAQWGLVAPKGEDSSNEQLQREQEGK